MGKINCKKTIICGLIAGVVINIIDFVVNGKLLMADWQAAMAKYNQPTEMTTGKMIGFIVMDFVLGLTLAHIYVGIRPRWGAGPKTAVKAALLLWIPVAVSSYGMTCVGISMNLYVMSTLGSLVAYLAGAVVGMNPYQE